MTVVARVDNISYLLLGYQDRIFNASNLTNMVVTPTRTQLTAVAGLMQFNLSFLNPIEVGNLVCLMLSSAHTFVAA